VSIRAAYNSWAEQYDSNKNRTRDMDEEITKTRLSALQFDHVLEIGCGTGKNTRFLVTRAQHITAVDFSEEMLSIARTKILQPEVEFLQADITQKWSFGERKYDLVTFSLVLEHIENLDFIFSEANKTLKPGGHIFVSELHPFKQYAGTKARFHNGHELQELETYQHHVSDFIHSAEKADLQLQSLQEHFDEDQQELPRLLSLIFQKI
tara:strand:+ start:224 stop:847 length:624 start_codon:yes stop_codon:yes gene_type:complete